METPSQPPLRLTPPRSAGANVNLTVTEAREGGHTDSHHVWAWVWASWIQASIPAEANCPCFSLPGPLRENERKSKMEKWRVWDKEREEKGESSGLYSEAQQLPLSSHAEAWWRLSLAFLFLSDRVCLTLQLVPSFSPTF